LGERLADLRPRARTSMGAFLAVFLALPVVLVALIVHYR